MIRTINGKDYNFKMTRKGLRKAESLGMDVNEIGSKPNLTLAYLWYAELYAAHPMKFDAAVELLDDFLDTEEETFTDLFEQLSNDYAEVFGVAAE